MGRERQVSNVSWGPSTAGLLFQPQPTVLAAVAPLVLCRSLASLPALRRFPATAAATSIMLLTPLLMAYWIRRRGSFHRSPSFASRLSSRKAIARCEYPAWTLVLQSPEACGPLDLADTYVHARTGASICMQASIRRTQTLIFWNRDYAFRFVWSCWRTWRVWHITAV